MPELPDLVLVRERLEPRIYSQTIASAEVRRPLVIRNLLGGDPVDRLAGRQFTAVGRRGKFLMLQLDGGLNLVVHPMLAGRLHYGPPLSRPRVRDALILHLTSGDALTYHDAKDMGKVYLTDDPSKVPGMQDLGPEANSPDLTPAAFAERIRRYRGEIKTVLTNQTFLAGIGNAYADEICWRAELYPFRKRAKLTPDEVLRLYHAMRDTLAEAIETLRGRVGDDIHIEVRDFLAVHGKPGQPCPRCRAAISEVKRERRATHFCRQCQPGLLVGGR